MLLIGTVPCQLLCSRHPILTRTPDIVLEATLQFTMAVEYYHPLSLPKQYSQLLNRLTN